MRNEIESSSSLLHKPVYPVAFRDAFIEVYPSFGEYEQQDAYLFLVMLLERVHEENKREPPAPPQNESSQSFVSADISDRLYMSESAKAWRYLRHREGVSFVSELFRGLQGTVTSCGHCGMTSVRFEPFQSLSLPIQNGDGSLITSVEDAFDASEAVNRLTGANQWDCGPCRERTDAKSLEIVTLLPRLLIVHLKRFEFLESIGASKLSHPVDFGLTLTLKDSLTLDRHYELFAVVYHHGTISEGHYTAAVRPESAWFRINDQYVRPIPPDQMIETEDAYILFYRMVESTKRNRKRLRIVVSPERIAQDHAPDHLPGMSKLQKTQQPDQ